MCCVVVRPKVPNIEGHRERRVKTPPRGPLVPRVPRVLWMLTEGPMGGEAPSALAARTKGRLKEALLACTLVREWARLRRTQRERESPGEPR